MDYAYAVSRSLWESNPEMYADVGMDFDLLYQQNQQLYGGRQAPQEEGAMQGQSDQQMSPQQGYDAYKNYQNFAGMGGPSGTTTNTGAISSIESGALSGAGETAGEAAGGGMGEGLSAVGGYVAAIIAAQQMMGNATDRRAGDSGNKNDVSKNEGHRTGTVFSGDFFTEPWQPYLYQQMGNDKLTPGEKTDAAIDRFREGDGSVMDVAKTAPATGAQWFDPAGSVGYDMLDDKGGKVGGMIGKAVFPVQGIARLFD